MRKFIWLLFFIAPGNIPAISQKGAEKKLLQSLDTLIGRRMHSIAPGGAVLVAKKGKVIYEKAFGIANMEWNVPVTTQTIFRLGSVTKEFTAVAILQLAEQGQLSLQDSIQAYLPDFPHKDDTLTIENLLTHTSGIIDFQVLNFNIPDAIRIGFPPGRIIDSLKHRPLQFKPGSKFSYSNTNYFLLGLIIEKVTGKSYQKYMEDHVFRPSGLTSTFYDDPMRIIPRRSSGYTKTDDHFLNAGYISMNWPFAAGALLSTITDLYRWHQLLYSYRLLKKETLEKAIAPFTLRNGQESQYGYGFFIRQWKGMLSVGHAGAIDGFRAMEIYFPEQDTFIAMLFNSDSDGYLSLFEDVFSMTMGRTMESSYKDIKIADSIIDKYTGTYAFVENTSLHLKIYKKNGRLYADLSDRSGSNMVLHAQSHSLFYLPDVKRVLTTIEFIVEGGQVTALTWTQEKKHEARKTE